MAVESSLVSTPFTIFVQKDSSRHLGSRFGAALVNLSIICIGLSLIQAIAWLIARPFLDVSYLSIFSMVLVTSPMLIARGFVRKFMLAIFQAGGLLVLDSIACFAQIIGLALLAYYEMMTPANALLVVGTSNLLSFVSFLVVKRKLPRFAKQEIREQISEDWSFGKWLVGEQTLNLMSVYGAPWLLALLMDSRAVGIFAACFSITGLANPILIGLGNYLLPRFSNDCANENDSRQTYWNFMSITFALMSIFAVLCFVFANELLVVFYPEKSYVGYGMVLAILAIRVLVGSVGMVAHFALLAMQKPKISLYASIVCITILLICSLILIPEYGPLGGAISCLAAAVAESLVMIISFQIYVQRKGTGRTGSQSFAKPIN